MNSSQPLKPPLYKNRFFWLLIGGVLLIGAVVFYNAKKYDFVNRKIQEVTAEKTNDLYKITYDSISINEATGDLFIHNLRVKGDTNLQKSYLLKGDTLAVPMLLDVFVPVLKVEGFRTAGALVSKRVVCNAIIINDPKVTVYLFPGISKQNDVKQQEQRLYKQLLGKFKLIQADSVSVRNSEIVAINFLNGDIKFHTFATSLRLTDLRIDSLHNTDTTRTLFSKEVHFHTDKVRLGHEPVIAEATYVTFDTRRKVLAIAGVAYNGLEAGQAFGAAVEGISIKELEVTGALDALQIAVGNADLKKVSLELKEQDVKKSGGGQQKNKATILNGWVKKVQLTRLQAGNISVKVDQKDNTTLKLLLNNSKLQVSDFTIDTLSRMDHSLITGKGNIQLSNNLVSIKTPDGLSTINFTGLKVNTSRRSVQLSEISIKPLFGEEEYARKNGVQKDRFDVSFRNIIASGINLEQLVDGNILVDAVNASNNSVRIYRDLSLPSDSVKKIGNYPHQMLHKLKGPLHIKKFVAANTYIQYKEKNPVSDSSGSLILAKSNISISNITNAPNPANKIMNMDFSGQLLNAIPLKVNIKFYLQDHAKGTHQVSASINKSFKADMLNPMIIPMGMVRIDNGMINDLTFDFMADNFNAQGSLVIRYDDLKLTLLKRDKNSQLNRKSVISFLANAVVRNSNPTNNKLRTAKVVYKRDEYKSFFNTIWKFVFTGIKDIMGAKF